MGDLAIWWSHGVWFFGIVSVLGQDLGFAHYTSQAHCPHQLTEAKWQVVTQLGWILDENLQINCKYITIKSRYVH